MLQIFDELETKRKNTQAGLPRAEGEVLFSFIKEHKIKRVIETGLAWGFSSYYILAALPPDGLLITIESYPKERKDLVVPPIWYPRWDIVPYPSETHLSDVLHTNLPIDLFFHDSHHGFKTQMFEYETVYPLVNFIGSHDIHLEGPPFAWDKFVEYKNIEVLVTLGQIAIGTKGPHI